MVEARKVPVLVQDGRAELRVGPLPRRFVADPYLAKVQRGRGVTGPADLHIEKNTRRSATSADDREHALGDSERGLNVSCRDARLSGRD